MSESIKGENQEKITTTIFHPWKVFGFEAFLFSLSLGLGILAGIRLREIFILQKTYPRQISLWQFIVWFVLGTLFILLVVYFVKFEKEKKLFFKGIFLLAVVFGNIFFFSIWLPDYASFFLVLALLFFWLKKRFLITHNLLMIFAISGIGAGVGLRLVPETVLLLFLIFSIYDYIAVYKTKHMVKMAKTMIEDRAILGIVIPQSFSGFNANLEKVKPGGRFLILGAGDIVFPLIFAVSFLYQSVFYALIIALFSLLGLLSDFLVFIFQKKRSPMPALPLIAFFSAIGYLLIKVI